jgi:polyisoprenoid-binding protein YceI
MKTILGALAMFTLLQAPAQAAEVDTVNSVITWKGSKVTGSYHSGLISPKSSSIQLTDGVMSGGEIVFDMHSMTVTNLDGTLKEKFLGHMKSPDFFDVAAHPTATFKVEAFKDGKMTGVLTIKGVSRPASFTATLTDGKYVGEATFNRTEFGITYGSGNFFEDLGDKMISDMVEVGFILVLKGGGA